jgi:hypothetical protein
VQKYENKMMIIIAITTTIKKISWNRVLEKLIVAQLVKTFTVFYGT